MAALALLCLTYVVGLLSTGLGVDVAGVAVGAIAFPIAGMVTGLVLPRYWRLGPRRGTWWLAGIVGLVAVLYVQLRFPQPASDDVSHLITVSDAPPVVEITGLIKTAPRLTRSGKTQFELGALQVAKLGQQGQPLRVKQVSGSVYVTVPPPQTALMPLQMVTVKGEMYRPKPATNPGGFNFEAYLAQRGIFAGLKGKQLNFPEQEGHFRSALTWQQRVNRSIQQSFWQVRQRVVQAQAEGLKTAKVDGADLGPLVSAMLLGKGAVDVDFDLRDLFSRVGLAHALAASGFQVSLLLSILLRLTGKLRQSVAIALCAASLLLYIGLTGLEPSVVRAGLMGGAVLLGLAMQRSVKPLGSLLAVGTLILIVNPLWIWDLGFQLSFLATLGLLVTAPILDKWFDWMPPAIASLISVPLAAYIWTLPIQLYAFGIVSPYSIALNMGTALLITLISLGSGVSALAALIYPKAGSLLAMALLLPTEVLVHLVKWVDGLPGNSFATGTIAVSQVLTLLFLYGVVWWQVYWWRRWWVIGTICVMVIAVPAAYAQINRVQVTILATKQPVMVIQQRGKVGVIGGSDRSDTHFTVLPFLRQQGINRIDWAIASPTSPPDGWVKLLQTVPIQQLYQGSPPSSPTPVPAGQTEVQQQVRELQQQRGGQVIPLTLQQRITTGLDAMRCLSLTPMVMQFRIGDQVWLLASQVTAKQDRMLRAKPLPDADVLWWWGGRLSSELLQKIRPEVAIASHRQIPPDLQTYFRDHQITAFATGRDGAVQWSPQQKFVTILSAAATEATTE
ncbi:MAG TPA: ComEC/Rec2 family competence protein [Synechococcales cyanobacterium M55_K2018_004]|nr:ComEC/Rec2 family competence protein [Synechococcales cyanobacterium M55_K2018_004]